MNGAAPNPSVTASEGPGAGNALPSEPPAEHAASAPASPLEAPAQPSPAPAEFPSGRSTQPSPAVTATVRALWEASRALLAAQPGSHHTARGLLHLEALRAATDAMDLERRAAHQALVEGRLGQAELLKGARATPANQLDEAQLALLELAHELTLADLERGERHAIRARERRLIRLGALACVGAALVAGADALWGRWRAPADLARNKPWATSSLQAHCEPAEGRCGPERMRALFFTKEEASPWFRIDLGGPTTFSSLTVVNRSDMLRERAVPLVVEVSDDLERWRELGRQKAVFTRWEPSFPPVTARYVRLRADRFTALHLEGVEVHP